VRRRKILIAKLISAFIVIAGIVFSLAWLSRLDLLKINVIEVKGNETLDAAEIQEIVLDTTAGAYANLFSKSNIFIYPKKNIVKAISSSFKRVNTLEISSSGLHKIKITITERKPSYTWCTGTPQVQTKTCYFIDSRGYVFSEAPTFSGHVYFSFYGNMPPGDPVGSYFIDEGRFKNLDRIIAMLENNGIDPYALQVKDNGVYDVYLNKGGRILFKEGQNISVLGSNIKSLIDQSDIFGKKLPYIDYVDMRFGSKVFYKLKEGDNADELKL